MDGMWLITTSLEALIQRACNVTNTAPDQDAIDAVCALILKEPECCGAAAKLMVAKAHSLQEWEALQALLVLENCMKRCGGRFHAEVGKFRFLNELIKLVSPKYLGGQTAASVKSRVLELMAEWANSLSREPKIKEAYDMLKKQGVIPEEKAIDKAQSISQSSTSADSQGGTKPRGLSVFDDEDQAQLLQRLLRSSKPADLQAANRLIKYMVKEDERRTEEKWRSATELETAVTQCSLLGDMLDRFAKEGGGAADVDLMAELHTGCLALRPALIRLANSPDPAFCSEVLTVNDELGEVLAKYRSVIGDSGRNVNASGPNALATTVVPPPPTTLSIAPEPSLLDLSPSPVTAAYSVVEPPAASLLEDIFGAQPSPSYTEDAVKEPLTNGTTNNDLPANNKSKALQELDLLGESMLKEILNSSAQQNKPPSKITMNDLMIRRKSSLVALDDVGQDLNELNLNTAKASGLNPALSCEPPTAVSVAESPTPFPSEPPAADCSPLALSSVPSENSFSATATSASTTAASPSSPAVSLTDEPLLGATPSMTPARSPAVQPAPLSDISLTIADVKPSCITPYKEAVGDVSLIITLAKDRPREDVSVHVITTTSTHTAPVEQLLFQPVVPKSCRLRLLPPSSTDLPPYNPFLPPAAITQIMLIASLAKEPIKMKYVISYIMQEETITEMCEIPSLPLSE